MSSTLNISKGKQGYIRIGIESASIDVPGVEQAMLVDWLKKTSLDLGESKWSFNDNHLAELQFHARGSVIEMYIQSADSEHVFSKTASMPREIGPKLALVIEKAEQRHFLP